MHGACGTTFVCLFFCGESLFVFPGGSLSLKMSTARFGDIAMSKRKSWPQGLHPLA